MTEESTEYLAADPTETEDEKTIRRRISIRDDIYKRLKIASKNRHETPNRIAQDAFKWYLNQEKLEM
jgi:hypothetical protein